MDVVIKFAALMVPSYIMCCYALPQGVCDQIESTISEFFWSGDVGKQKIHWPRLEWPAVPKRIKA